MHGLELGIGFDRFQGDCLGKLFDGLDIECGPVAFGGGGIGIGSFGDLGETDKLFGFAAVIEKDEIAFGHLPYEVACLVIADAVPDGLLFGD